MRKSWIGIVAAMVILLLVLGIGVPGSRTGAQVDNTLALNCVFLSPGIDGDEDDGVSVADVVAACDGLSAAEISNLAVTAGDEDGSLEPTDLENVDIEANQISTAGDIVLTTIYVIAFVDDDETVTFDAEAGVAVTISDDGGPDDGTPADDANPETCDGDDDADCGTSVLGDGDGVVVATVAINGAQPGDQVDVDVSQEGTGGTETLSVVGAPASVALTLVEATIQMAAGGECTDGKWSVNDGATLANPRATLAQAVVTDADGRALTRIATSFSATPDEVAAIGDETFVSVDLGSDGIAALAVICGGSQAGVATITADIGTDAAALEISIVSVLEAGPPRTIELKVTPPEIACNGVDTGVIRVRLRDDNEQPITDGTSVYFGVESPSGGNWSLDPTDGLTSGGEVITQVRFESLENASFFDVRASTDGLSGSIRVRCKPIGGCSTGLASPPCPTPSAAPTLVPCIDPMSPPNSSPPCVTATPTVFPPPCEWPFSPPNCVSATPGAPPSPPDATAMPRSTRTAVRTLTPAATRTAVPTATSTPQPNACADVTGDGRVTRADIAAIAAHTHQRYNERYDINGDGKVNFKDVLAAWRQLGRTC